ncbi:hypothetical protein GCM10027436_52540 [Actinophytocola sediminis]
MAHNSTSRRRFGAAVGAFGVSVVAAAALIGMAGTASAHTPKFSSDCAEDGSWVKVELTQYNDKEANTVAVSIDGAVVAEEEFGKGFEQTFDKLDPAAEHTAEIKVVAWDDPDASKGFSFTEGLTIEACAQPSTPPEEPTVPSETPEEPAPSTTPEEVPPPASTEAPTTSVEVEEAALAETGASIAIPLGIGAVLLAGGVVLMVVVRRRGRADHQA